MKLEKKRPVGRKAIFNLVATSEEPEINLSLRKRIERGFNLLLPDFTADEEAHETVSEDLSAVQTAMRGQKRWRVRRQVTLALGHFAFGRLGTYADLEPELWRRHPVGRELVRSVLSGAEMGSESDLSPFSAVESYPID